MTDKIEIPEEVMQTLKYKIDAYSISNLAVAERFLWDIIQKQDNEIGVGDWFWFAEHSASLCKAIGSDGDIIDHRGDHFKPAFVRKVNAETQEALNKENEVY
jgi:hypothetical protein